MDVIKRTFHEFNTAATVGPVCHGVEVGHVDTDTNRVPGSGEQAA